MLLSADGVGTMEIQRRTGKGKPTIWRWQERFMRAGVDGLLRDATRPSRKPPLASDVTIDCKNFNVVMSFTVNKIKLLSILVGSQGVTRLPA